MTHFPSDPSVPSAPPPGPPFPYYPIEPDKPKSKVVSILALVFGGVALLLGLIPLVGVFFALFFGIAAIVLGIIGALKSHRMMAIIGLALAVIGVVVSFVVANATADAIEASLGESGMLDENLTSEDAEAEEPDEAPDAAPGQQPESPLPAGTEVEAGNWIVSIGNVTPDATEAVLAENPYKPNPDEGFQYFMYQVDATYIGDDSSDIWLDLAFGVYINETVHIDSCGGAVADDPYSAPEVFKDEQVTVNICVTVPSDGVDNALISVQEIWSMDQTQYFVEID